MSDEKKHWPFDGFFLKLSEAQQEYEQELFGIGNA